MIPMQKNQFHPNNGLDTARLFTGSSAHGTWRCYEGMVVQPGLHDWFWPDLGGAVDHRRKVNEVVRVSKPEESNDLSQGERTPSN